MALDTTSLPFGVRDIKLTPINLDGTLGTPIDLPYARTLSFTDSTDSEELRGDDQLITSHDKGTTVNWELESGGLPFEAFKVMSGGTVTTSGTGSTQTKSYVKSVSDSRPFFKIEGQVISDSGGDLHVVLPRCKATGDLSGEFSDGNFFLTSAQGDGYAAQTASTGITVGMLYAFIQNQTTTPIATS